MQYVKLYEDFLNEAKPGPDPYMKGLSDETEEEKEEQMKKQAEMDDDDDSAYKELPGDKEAQEKGQVKTSKHTKSYHELYGESTVNEDVDSLLLGAILVVQAAILGGNIGVLAARYGDNTLGPIDSIKKWWKERKDDKAIKSIIAKIEKDPEMIEFFKLSQSQQRGKFRKLIATKLSGDEIQYLNRINKGDLIQVESMEIDEAKEQSTDRSAIDDDAIETGLKTKSEETGVPIGILRAVMRRGLAAWKTGHRPGANQQQWGYARVNSFLTKQSGTWGGADKDLAKEVRDGGHDKNLK